MDRLFRSHRWSVGQLDLSSRSRIVMAGFSLAVALAPVTAAAQLHTIAPGETLSGIAALYGVDMATLAARNGISNPSLIYAGSNLTIPDPGQTWDSATVTTPGAVRHTVVAGDTLAKIAGQYGVPLLQLAEDNRLADPDLIIEGQVLIIGGPVPEVEAPAPATPAPAPAPAPPVTHIVGPGDTLASIAALYGVSVLALAEQNRLADPNLIVLGQELTISGAPVAAPPPPGPLPSAEVRAILREVEAEFEIPAGLLQALAWQESGWQQQVTSNAGAVGVTQLLPITALWALEFLLQSDADWEASARDNVRVGASVMRHYLRLTAGDVRWSLAAYYQGWQSVQDFGMFEETELYVANVMSLWAEFQ